MSKATKVIFNKLCFLHSFCTLKNSFNFLLTDFIVKIVADLLEEQPNGQIMILAHNRSLLTYLHDSSIGQALGLYRKIILNLPKSSRFKVVQN